MDETAFRILDILSRDIGNPNSIYRLTYKIREFYGTAHYPNIYRKLHALSEDGIISLASVGKSSIASLNFANYTLLDALAEIELRKKRELLKKAKALGSLVSDLETMLRHTSLIQSASLINPERNARLNRAELLILIRNPENSLRQIASIHNTIRKIRAGHDIRADALMLSHEEFLELLTSDETNPLREMMSNKTAFHSPQAFWAEIADVMAGGRRIRFLGTETNPAKIAEEDLAFNLSRFGYRELGRKTGEGQKICLEYIITSILMKRDARRINSIPMLLLKNEFNRNLLLFLSRKYGLSHGLLRAVQKTKSHGKIALMIENMRSYDAAR